jgi:hypothetical protein
MRRSASESLHRPGELNDNRPRRRQRDRYWSGGAHRSRSSRCHSSSDIQAVTALLRPNAVSEPSRLTRAVISISRGTGQRSCNALATAESHTIFAKIKGKSVTKLRVRIASVALAEVRAERADGPSAYVLAAWIRAVLSGRPIEDAKADDVAVARSANDVCAVVVTLVTRRGHRVRQPCA